MYCPKCGKQQPSERNRFCTGCGLGLTHAANLLAADTMPMASDSKTTTVQLSPRVKGILQGLAMVPVLAGLFFLLIAIYDNYGADVMDATYSAMTLILLLALMRILYAIFFEEGKKRRSANVLSKMSLDKNRQEVVLPPADTGMAAVLQPLNRRTGEIIQSIGITERTTRQLGESNN